MAAGASRIAGIAGALVIAHWLVGLARASGAVLVDALADARLAGERRARLEVGTDRLTDLHVWRVGPGHVAVIAAVVSDQPQDPDRYKSRLDGLRGLSHVTIEMHQAPRPTWADRTMA